MSPEDRLKEIKKTIFEGNITKEAHASFAWLISRVEHLEKALQIIKIEGSKGDGTTTELCCVYTAEDALETIP